MNFYMHIQQAVQDQYAALLEYRKKKYVAEAIFGFGMIVILFAGYHGYGWYQKRQDRQAFAGLIEISKAYEQALQKSRKQTNSSDQDQAQTPQENPWEDVQLLLQAIGSAHAGSRLAPFFIAYEAELALQADQDHEKACKLMEKAVRGLSKSSPYYEMLNLKRIKMQLDSKQQATKERALEQLKELSMQEHSYYAPEALLLLGNYHACYGNMEQAIHAWKKLAQQPNSDKALLKNIWAQQAQDKLKSLHIAW